MATHQGGVPSRMNEVASQGIFLMAGVEAQRVTGRTEQSENGG